MRGRLSSSPDDPAQARGRSFPSRTTQLATFSCWCPKAMAAIGRLPDTLADRCIVIRMQRKTTREKCERLKYLDPINTRRQCARFVLDHQDAIATARPDIPASLNDRAADIWEPLLALADLAGGPWPNLSREAATGLSASAQQSNPIGSLLLDIYVVFTNDNIDRIFTKDLVGHLNAYSCRPWMEIRHGKEINDHWLSQQLRPYGIQPRTMRIGETRAKGYLLAEFRDAFRRYISKADLDLLLSETRSDDLPAGGAQDSSCRTSSEWKPD